MDNCTIIRTYFRSRKTLRVKLYKHKYFIMFMNLTNAKTVGRILQDRGKQVEWKTYDDVNKCIRPYNLEKLA
jgi:hypothetical protein